MSDSDPDAVEPPDSMEDVLAEALAEEEESAEEQESAEEEDSADEPSPSLDEVDIRDALRAALKPPEDGISVTKSVQKKLREDPDLEGRYFADGWSTATAPKETFLITSIVMLVVAIVVYYLISPYGL